MLCSEWWTEAGWLRLSSCVWNSSSLLLCRGIALTISTVCLARMLWPPMINARLPRDFQDKSVLSVLCRVCQSDICSQKAVTLSHLQLVRKWPVFTAQHSYASAVLKVVILSVHPSVCHTLALWLIQRTYRRYFYTTWKGDPSFLPPNSGWWATSPSTYNGWLKWPTPFKICSRRQISACNIWTVRASEKRSIMTNRKSYTGFPTSYRWTAYVTSKSPLQKLLTSRSA